MTVTASTEADEVEMGGAGAEGKGKMPAGGGAGVWREKPRCRSWGCLQEPEVNMKGMWLICEVVGHQQGSEKVTREAEAANTRLLRAATVDEWSLDLQQSLRKWCKCTLQNSPGQGQHTHITTLDRCLVRDCPWVIHGAVVSS